VHINLVQNLKSKRSNTRVVVKVRQVTKFLRFLETESRVKIQFVHNPNPDEYTQVNHIGEDTTNFKIENLEWTSPKRTQSTVMQSRLTL
jgi:hypothetical protein